MTAEIVKLRPSLQRVIVLRQVDAGRWKVEGYERQSARWYFTWLLYPIDAEMRARRYAANLAQQSGLPLAELRIGGRIRLIDGVLGRAA